MVQHKTFGPAQNILRPVKGQGIREALTCSVFRKWFELNVSFVILKIFTYKESLFVLPFGPITVSVFHLKFRYSSVPNRRAGPNKRAGGKILEKRINM